MTVALPVNYFMAMTQGNLGFPGWKAHLVLSTKRFLFSSSLTPEHQNPPDSEMKTKSGANHPAQLCPGSLELSSDELKTLFSL